MIYVATTKSFGYMGRLWEIGDKTPDTDSIPPEGVFAPAEGYKQNPVVVVEDPSTFSEMNHSPKGKTFKEVYGVAAEVAEPVVEKKIVRRAKKA